MFDEATLRRLYLDERKSIREIAALAQLSPRTVFDALCRYHIPRRPAGFPRVLAPAAAKQLQEEALRRWYVEEERSITEIAGLIHVSTRTVFDALKRYRIPRRPRAYRKQRPQPIGMPPGALDEATLRRLYEEDGLSIVAVAAALQHRPSHIRNALIRWGIPLRRRGRPSSSD